MYFISSQIGFDSKDMFKYIAKQIGMKSRFDFRLKKWEAYGKKPLKKQEKIMIDFIESIGAEYHSWSGKDTYSKNVYTKLRN